MDNCCAAISSHLLKEKGSLIIHNYSLSGCNARSVHVLSENNGLFLSQDHEKHLD